MLNGVDNLYFPELTTAAGATLYTPTIYDPDTGQTQTVTINVYPSGQTDMFTVTAGSTSLSSSPSLSSSLHHHHHRNLQFLDCFRLH